MSPADEPEVLGGVELVRDRDWFGGHVQGGTSPSLSFLLFTLPTFPSSLPLTPLDSLLTSPPSPQYLRIKRAVQAAFNTEASYLSAKLQQMQASAAATAAAAAQSGGEAADPMAALESGAGGAMRGFVAASSAVKIGGGLGEQEPETKAQENADEIAMDDDDSDDE